MNQLRNNLNIFEKRIPIRKTVTHFNYKVPNLTYNKRISTAPPLNYDSTEMYMKNCVADTYGEINDNCELGELCKSNESNTKMIRCDHCEGWYHIICCGISNDSSKLENSSDLFFCDKCT